MNKSIKEHREKAYGFLREAMNKYADLSEQTWKEFIQISKLVKIKKGENLVALGDKPHAVYFVYKGLFRAFILGGEDFDKEVNKNFFDEGRFPASISALLQKQESEICIQALEDSIIIEINHDKYRGLLKRFEDLKWYHIQYLEAHWILEKEPQELSLLGDDSKNRYLKFLKQYPHLEKRIALYHIASKIGITPTQLSRIRKEIKL